MAGAASDETGKRKQRYVEISDWLIARCAELPPGSPVPSEAQLAEQFKVSRMTARHALETVRATGRIERRKGVGSFVAPASLHRSESVLRSFSDEIRRRNGEPSSVVVEQGLVVLPSQALLMGLDPHEPLVRIDRVRCSDGIPVAKEVSHLPGKLKAILGEDFATASLHEVLRGLGISPARATGYMTARLATPGECELLRQDPPAALLVETRTVTDAKGEIIESTETAYVGSRWAMATSAAVLP
ncbi:GntR family transcriptional regulator [Arachnia propionica]|jgi:transcriptional regulator, gntR family|uniref:GntR family transcriptional regulator n=1 Tax=Arachnia propionica TaxID=1750 RepID=UPI0039902F14